jgi:DNA anti-recombination protein RmuC
MGLGSTAKKLQTVAERAEKVYTRMNKLREEVKQTQETVDETKFAVESLEDELREQRAVLYAIAEEQGIDANGIAAETHISEAEAEARAAGESESETNASNEENAGGSADA